MNERFKLWHVLVLVLVLAPLSTWGANTMFSALSTLSDTTVATGDELVLLDISDTTHGAGGTAKTITAQNLQKYYMANGLNVLGGSQVARTAGHTISATTATEITDLQVTLPAAGTYVADYYLMAQSATATVGLAFASNFTGTTTSKACFLVYPTTGTTAGTGTADDAGATSQLAEAWGTNTNATGTPNMGPYTGGVATTGANILHMIKCVFVVSTSGDMELWHASETATSTTVSAGSSVVVMRTN